MPDEVNLDYGIIAFFDVLGTSSHKDAAEVKGFVNKFNHLYESIEGKYGDPVAIRDRTPKHCKYNLGNYFWIGLSDTIVVAFKIDSNLGPEQEYFSIKGAAVLSADLLRTALQNDLPLRGVISVGEYYYQDFPQMMVGSAVYEAAKYYRVPKWNGVSLAPSAHSKVTKYFSETTSRDIMDEIFVRYDIPIEYGLEKDGWACNWPKVDILKQCFNVVHPTIEEGQLRNKLINNLSSDVKFKWRNTLSFMDHVFPI